MVSRTTEKAVNILLVEDNRGDAILIEMLAGKWSFPVNTKIAHDGEEALNFLDGGSPFGDEIHPDLILLDLNLPKIDGHQVLSTIKSDPKLREIPVLVLTSSNNPRDKELTLKNHADGYFVKGMNMDELTAVMAHIEEFWLKFKKEKG